VIVLRSREPQIERPYRVLGYPITPLIFSAVCAFLIYKSVSHAISFRRISLIVMVAALALGALIYRMADARSASKER
jgi:APA family basic amino acid/polyamine antiporter